MKDYTDAANKSDLERFLSLYHPAVRKYRFSGQLASEGLAHNRQAYAKSFTANPDLHVEKLAVMTFGDKVVAYNRVTGLAGGKTADEITAYQVENGLITNIVYIERIGR
ncbi:nuclear transport factor 2 family protein [Sphingosinicella sp. BN140058]|uniref:nuclear transport factor 2 family protein n=1 Tax=Sphingosinicella sp. BN140058 TaxID=1892855 RepID=UPI0013EC57D5|nr:nuclear transport factor 2 family protein [Sphingosinicella sp. BN140058]